MLASFVLAPALDSRPILTWLDFDYPRFEYAYCSPTGTAAKPELWVRGTIPYIGVQSSKNGARLALGELWQQKPIPYRNTLYHYAYEPVQRNHDTWCITLPFWQRVFFARDWSHVEPYYVRNVDGWCGHSWFGWSSRAWYGCSYDRRREFTYYAQKDTNQYTNTQEFKKARTIHALHLTIENGRKFQEHS